MSREGKRCGIDFFDLDHTLIQHSSARHFALVGIRQRILPLSLLAFMPLYYFYYRFGNIKIAFFDKNFRFLKGIHEQEFQRISALSFQKRLKRDLYPEARTLIRELKASGRRIAIATSSPYVVVKPLADYLGIEEILATRLEFRNGISTGRILGIPLFEWEKRRQVLGYIRKEGFKARDCTFYSDSIHDLPLLKSIGEPVVVNPDPRLRLIARRRGWRIIRFSASPRKKSGGNPAAKPLPPRSP